MEHPSFASAERLDTSFIQLHKAVLLAPQPMPPKAAAIAAVARHLFKVRAHTRWRWMRAAGVGVSEIT